MKSRLTDDLGLKVISLLLGCSLWYAVAREQGAEFVFSIPIELRDVPDGLEVVDQSVQQVDVRIRGPAEILRRLSPQDLRVAVDLSDAEPGERVGYLTPDDVRVPFGARVMRVTPASLRIGLDRTLERTVNVIPRVLGAPAEGFELQQIELIPQQVTVVGPASLVRGVEQVTTEPLSAEGLRQPFSRSVRLELDPLIRLVGDTSVELSLDVREVRLRKELAGVTVSTMPDGVSAAISPDSVRILVEGPRSVVSELQSESFSAEVRIDGLARGEHRLVPIVRVPEGAGFAALHIVSVSPEEIDVRVR